MFVCDRTSTGSAWRRICLSCSLWSKLTSSRGRRRKRSSSPSSIESWESFCAAWNTSPHICLDDSALLFFSHFAGKYCVFIPLAPNKCSHICKIPLQIFKTRDKLSPHNTTKPSKHRQVQEQWSYLQEKRRAERAEQQRVRAEREKERQARLAVSSHGLKAFKDGCFSSVWPGGAPCRRRRSARNRRSSARSWMKMPRRRRSSPTWPSSTALHKRSEPVEYRSHVNRLKYECNI